MTSGVVFATRHTLGWRCRSREVFFCHTSTGGTVNVYRNPCPSHFRCGLLSRPRRNTSFYRWHYKSSSYTHSSPLPWSVCRSGAHTCKRPPPTTNRRRTESRTVPTKNRHTKPTIETRYPWTYVGFSRFEHTGSSCRSADGRRRGNSGSVGIRYQSLHSAYLRVNDKSTTTRSVSTRRSSYESSNRVSTGSTVSVSSLCSENRSQCYGTNGTLCRSTQTTPLTR